MSDTKNQEVPNNVINYIVYGQEQEKLKITETAKNTQDANIYNIPGIPMEIQGEEFIVTNETKDGKVVVKDKKTGDIIGYLDPDGTLVRKLEEIDRKQEKAGSEIGE